MRFYGFGNYYLSSLQQGLQSAHVISELFNTYESTSISYNYIKEWSKNHKTIILLNGGNSSSLQDLYSFFEQLRKEGMKLPFTKFHEDSNSLNNALTSVGIIIPEIYYSLSSKIREMNDNQINSTLSSMNLKQWEINLVVELNKYKLAF